MYWKIEQVVLKLKLIHFLLLQMILKIFKKIINNIYEIYKHDYVKHKYCTSCEKQCEICVGREITTYFVLIDRIPRLLEK